MVIMGLPLVERVEAGKRRLPSSLSLSLPRLLCNHSERERGRKRKTNVSRGNVCPVCYSSRGLVVLSRQRTRCSDDFQSPPPLRPTFHCCCRFFLFFFLLRLLFHFLLGRVFFITFLAQGLNTRAYKRTHTEPIQVFALIMKNNV